MRSENCNCLFPLILISSTPASFQSSQFSQRLYSYKRKAGRNLRLWREKEVVSVDRGTHGKEEFIVMNMISVLEEKFVLVVEAKKSSIGEAMKQCLLSLKDMRDGNGGGTVYGFTITGTIWRTFQTTNEILALFDLMGEGGGDG
jgi:hypothetical protein